MLWRADVSDSTHHRGVLVHVSATDSSGEAEQMTMTKTVVIAMSCVVAYLGVMAALTVYCLIHMLRARRLRKHNQLQSDDLRELPSQLTPCHQRSNYRGHRGPGPFVLLQAPLDFFLENWIRVDSAPRL